MSPLQLPLNQQAAVGCAARGQPVPPAPWGQPEGQCLSGAVCGEPWKNRTSQDESGWEWWKSGAAEQESLREFQASRWVLNSLGTPWQGLGHIIFGTRTGRDGEGEGSFLLLLILE